MLLGDTRRQMDIAQVPARERGAIGTVGGDDVIRPGIVGAVAVLAKIVGGSRSLARRRMAIVTVSFP